MYVWKMWKWRRSVFDCATIYFWYFFLRFHFSVRIMLITCCSVQDIPSGAFFCPSTLDVRTEMYLQKLVLKTTWTIWYGQLLSGCERNVRQSATQKHGIWTQFLSIWWQVIGVHNSRWEFGYGTSRSKNWIQKVQVYGLRYWSMFSSIKSKV